MRQWLLDNGFDSPHLHWYVNYACRDDYGTDYRETSAWAGIHYFACRNGEADAENQAGHDTVLTAPEGNGWIVRKLAQRFADRTVTGALAFRVRQDRQSVGGRLRAVPPAPTFISRKKTARYVTRPST